jgi:hypothetical protein
MYPHTHIVMMIPCRDRASARSRHQPALSHKRESPAYELLQEPAS